MTATADPIIRVAFVSGWSSQRAPGLARYASELGLALERAAAARSVAGPAVDRRPVGTTTAGAARIAWSQTILLTRLARLRPDVTHITAPPVPLAWRGQTVLTLHDLSLVRSPWSHPRSRAVVSGTLLRASAHRATRLIVPSRATAADVVDLLGVDPARLHVIPEAPAPWFAPVSDPVAIDAVLGRHRLRPGYLLALGTLEPRKNLGTIVLAAQRLAAGGLPVRLVLVGSKGWGDAATVARAAGATEGLEVRHLGRVPDADLPALYSAAGAVAYPSLLEGFGLPVVEALACGAPVVTSDRGATAEVAGDAALLVDPTDPAALADGLSVALTPGPGRDRLRHAGPARAATFSWDSAAAATMDVYALAAGTATGRSVTA